MSASVVTRPHFFQPLISGFENEFSIPVSFFKYLKGQECCRLTLRSQGGKLWSIKINGRQFEDGWKQFIQDHDLHIGDFLVFRHEGDLVFDVLVFDRTTCQRDYLPFAATKEEETDVQKQNHPIYTAHAGSLSPSHLHANTKVSELGKSQLKNPEVTQESGSSKSKKYKQPETASEAKASSSSVVQKSYFIAKRIPAKFSREHLKNKKYSKVVLRDQEGKSWPATLLYQRSDEEVHIVDGWKVLSDANELKLGDAFVFELTENGKMPVFKMHGFKAFAGKNQEGASNHFYVHMQVSHYKTFQLKIPRNFARRHGFATSKCSAVTIKNEMGNSSSVLLRMDKNNEVFMTHGWFEFVKENGIEEGDVFMLELVKGGTKPEMQYYALKQEMDNSEEGIWEDSEDVKPIV